MNFLTALKAGRPMCRASKYNRTPWYFLGKTLEIFPKSIWRNIVTGEVIDLDLYDYLADDWEVMP